MEKWIEGVVSLACIGVAVWLWKALKWIWLTPIKLEKRLRKQGFHGRSYRLLHGDKKETVEMVRLASAKPMHQLSNDFVPRILPFLHHTLLTYGEKAFIWEGPKPAVIITKPELIREVLMKMRDFQKPKTNPVIKKLSNGLTRLEGDKWAHDRKLITPAFHMNKLKHMLPALHKSCEDMMAQWEEKLKTSASGEVELEMWSFLQNMSADAISRAAFGSSFEQGRRLFELLRDQVALTMQSLQSVYIPGLRFLPTKINTSISKYDKEIRTLLEGMIYRRIKAMQVGEAPKDDLLGILLKSSLVGESKDEYGEGDKRAIAKLSLKEVIEECKLFYLAGQETTSSLLVWTLILLSKHQDWQQQAREEILDTFGNDAPHFDGLNQLKKVSMILHEAIRLYPPLSSLVREVSHDMKIGDEMHLPKGVLINMPMVYVHHDEKLWGADAKEFKPERFGDGILKATAGNMSLFSFGWGPRICIGSNFAMMEAKMALCLILRRFSLNLSPSYAHAPTLGRGTLRPQFGAPLLVQPL